MAIERTSVGLDVHARTTVAAAIDEQTGELVQRRMGADTDEIVAWVAGLPGPVAATYEAGPTGFGLARALSAAGVRAVVAAPSKLQRPVGDRVKTDMRDAVHLARLLRLGEVVAVSVPSIEAESARDLVRAREDARGDLMSARHRVSKLLLRQGIQYSDGKAWTVAHQAWLRSQRFELVGLQAAFDAAYDAMIATVDRRNRLDVAIAAMAAESEFAPVVDRLCCLRGVSTLTGFALAVEIGDWTRLDGRRIGSYVGLTPSENSSGASRALGGITKTGNGHARRLLIEAAWHHRPTYRASSPIMRARWDRASAEARARGHAGNQRLHQRWQTFQARKKRTVVANAAIARELAGWCWPLAVMT